MRYAQVYTTTNKSAKNAAEKLYNELYNQIRNAKSNPTRPREIIRKQTV